LNKQKSKAFTVRFPVRKLQIICPVGIIHAGHGLDLANPKKGDQLRIRRVPALWDTGATHSLIVPSVVKECKLEQHSFTNSSGIEGKITRRPSYPADLFLPSNVIVGEVELTELERDDQLGNDIQMLIGMDVISLGDFALSYENGNTVFSFRVPGRKVIDFVEESKGGPINEEL